MLLGSIEKNWCVNKTNKQTNEVFLGSENSVTQNMDTGCTGRQPMSKKGKEIPCFVMVQS